MRVVFKCKGGCLSLHDIYMYVHFLLLLLPLSPSDPSIPEYLFDITTSPPDQITVVMDTESFRDEKIVGKSLVITSIVTL